MEGQNFKSVMMFIRKATYMSTYLMFLYQFQNDAGAKEIFIKMRNKLFFVFYFLLFTGYCLLFFPACSRDNSKQPAGFPPAPVTVASVITQTVPVQIRAIGNVEAYSTVAIKARVGGELLSVNFKEGHYVNKGDLLFTIDPQTYKTTLEAAQANLARDTALSKKADNDVIRYTGLFQEQLVSRDDYEKILVNAEALKAIVAADRSAVENAKLQLDYCYIYAPVSGRTGGLLADQGNLIKANDVPMVVINQIQPVYVTLSVPEHDLPEIKKYMAAGELNAEAFLSDNDNDPEKGTLTFMDNTVDVTTGTIKLKATFSNKNKKLWPGQFVNVIMSLTTLPGAIVIPSQAVQTGQQGSFVFVVKDGSAELRPVNVGITHEDMMVIESGLVVGEEVVTDGQMRLMPGAKVEIMNTEGKK